MTAGTFAREMGVNRRTVMRWLQQELVPGARLRVYGSGMKCWEIPARALKMKRQKPGPKPRGARNGDGKSKSRRD